MAQSWPPSLFFPSLEAESTHCVDQGGWPQIHGDPPAPVSLRLGLKVCNAIPSSFSLNCKNNLDKRSDSIWFSLHWNER